jgi:succinate-semialdehyde dehydrogenase/glutarate-semialdehyde dehydrogenase
MTVKTKIANPALALKDPSLLRGACLVDGEWIAADDGSTLEVTNPATGTALTIVPNMGAAETRRAIAGADKALPAWRTRTAKERATILRKWFDLMMANQEDLAVIMTAEQGKPLESGNGREGSKYGIEDYLEIKYLCLGGI